ncbi:MAG TPA: SDR family oxidoreductase [Anaerolineaceae bacterium]
METNYDGKVALVTGASQGIGRAAALAFGKAGAGVIVSNRTVETGEETAHEIDKAGGKAIFVRADVSVAEQVENLIRVGVNHFGRLDCAFNNAGSGGNGGWLADIAEMDWDQTVDGYLKSVFLCMKFELHAMLEQGKGAIVNNSSVDGERAFPWDPVYSAAKHGVLGLTKSAAVQYAQKGIRINAVCPGWILTPQTEQLRQDSSTEAHILSHQPIARFGLPEEVAEAVLWLCSERASLVVGIAMPVDGGYLAV